MKIIEGVTAAGNHVWIVIERAAEGKEVETGFRTEEEARSYRSALLAYRQSPNHWLGKSVERLRRSATVSYGHNR